MKKLFLLVLAFGLVFFACDKDDETDDLKEIRENAWNSLTESEKESVTIAWKDAHVESGTYEEKDVYSVRFNTTYDPLLGPIVVYVDKSTKQVLGQMLRM